VILKARMRRSLLRQPRNQFQSAIDAAFDAQLTINLTVEFEKALKNYRQVHAPQIPQHSQTKITTLALSSQLLTTSKMK